MLKVACFLILFAVAFREVKSANVFRFANVFGDHMVLQQAPKRAIIWGYGEVGQEVVVEFSGHMYSSFVTPKKEGERIVGIWTVMLVPTMFGGPYRLGAHSVVDKKMVRITLYDVMFGDVWICSGQSNMEYSVIGTDNGAKAINGSANYDNIRLFTAENDCQTTPQMELKKIRLPWSRPSPKTVGGPIWKYFSAVCWYYGVQLYEELKYPIGLIATSWGATPVEAWSSPDALAACGINEIVNERKFELKDLHFNGPSNHSCLWNAQIFPFVKVTIYGSIWYQGESNALTPVSDYNCTFPAMIDDWRAKWYNSTQHNTDPMFPFGFVQLSSVGNDTGSKLYFPSLRWDQTAQFGYVPNARQKSVFMAVAMDLGNLNAPLFSSHPTDKTDVGKRLALAGLAVGYGEDKYYTGPLVSTIKRHPQPPSLALEISFKSLSEKIEVRSNVGFEVHCESGGGWVEAVIFNQGPTSVFIVPRSLDCVADKVRYAWSNYPCDKLKCAIYSGDLPCPPFIMDGPFEAAESSLFEKILGKYI